MSVCFLFTQVASHFDLLHFLPPLHVHFISPLGCQDYQVNITLTKQLNSLDNCSKPLLGDHVTDAVPQSVFRLNLELFDAKLISVLQG